MCPGQKIKMLSSVRSWHKLRDKLFIKGPFTLLSCGLYQVVMKKVIELTVS